MSRERFVVLGLARARSAWFRAVAQWSTSAALPAQFVKCVSREELRAWLATGRPFSAALLDAGLPGVDRDLLAEARDAGCAPLVVDDGRGGRDWAALGAAAVLSPDFTREDLVDALGATARMVGGGDAAVGPRELPDPRLAREARVVTVCGAGGTGASTAAAALAQQLAADPRGTAPVLLADLALRAEQAVLHDAGDIVPGIQELADACRGRHPDAEEVRALTFAVEGRGYRLLLGLRRPRYWATVRPRAFEAAFDALRRSFGTVVCDITADFEGEDEGGSVDVEERNVMARTAAQRADAVVVVGVPGVKGLHALVRVVGDLLDAGVPAARMVPVVNTAPRSPRLRAEMASAFAQLTGARASSAAGAGASDRHGAGGVGAPQGVAALAAPVFLPRRRVDEAVRDGAPLPAPLGPLLAGAVRAVLARSPRAASAAPPEPVLVAPGSLGSWAGPDTPEPAA